MKTRFHVIIPARLGSTRLPRKPLLELAGRPLIEWVWVRARASGAASVIVATDDARIEAAARRGGADCVLTGEHASGTDRIAEVVRARGFAAEDIVVNLQGDEPLMPPEVIARVAAALHERAGVDLATAVAPIETLADFLDPNCVKALGARDGRALYFSRAPVPWPRDASAAGRPERVPPGALRHVGLYAFRVVSLLRFAALDPTPLERIERLEQLRALENGLVVQLVRLEHAPPPGVDTPEDLERVRALLEKR